MNRCPICKFEGCREGIRVNGITICKACSYDLQVPKLKLQNGSLENQLVATEKENVLLRAKVSWLDQIYAGIFVSHPHLTPVYPGDTEVLKIFKSEVGK